ncbi:MAG TPA: MAPEG family protein [Steroidobacteraceae bacterium]
MSTLTPVLALICWTFVIWFWMYVTRLPAMRAARIDPAKIKRKEELDVLPVKVKQIADNYNHLHEQPTVFYALAIYSHVAGTADPINVWLAWAYVGIRIVHSLIQCTTNFVPVRFFVFVAGTLVLIVMTARNVLALFPPTPEVPF